MTGSRIRITRENDFGEIEVDAAGYSKPVRKQRPTWTSKDGEVFYMDEMETRYLKNCYHKTVKNGSRTVKLEQIKAELRRRGENIEQNLSIFNQLGQDVEPFRDPRNPDYVEDISFEEALKDL